MNKELQKHSGHNSSESMDSFHQDRDSSRELNVTVWTDNLILPNPDRSSIEFNDVLKDVHSSSKEEYMPDNQNFQNPDRRKSIVVEFKPSNYVPSSSKDDNLILQNSNKRIVEFDSTDGIPPSTTDEIMALGYPSNENIYEMLGCVYSFNNIYGMSNWVCECLTYDQIHKVSDKAERKSIVKDNWTDFEGIVKLADYINSGYDKGHLAAARNHKYNFKAYEGTFEPWNIAPMHKKVNQIFNKIEEQGRKFAKKYKKVYSVTGTIFYPERTPIFMKEGSDVRVPDAFFKMLVHEDTHKNDDIHKVYGYMLENKPDDHDYIIKANKDLQHIRKYWLAINSLTGLNILCNLDPRRIRDDSYRHNRSFRGSGV